MHGSITGTRRASLGAQKVCVLYAVLYSPISHSHVVFSVHTYQIEDSSYVDVSHQQISSRMQRHSSAASDRVKDKDREREPFGDGKDSERRVLDRQLVLSRNQIQVLTEKIDVLNEAAAKK